jgi:hypothetical protein
MTREVAHQKSFEKALYCRGHRMTTRNRHHHLRARRRSSTQRVPSIDLTTARRITLMPLTARALRSRHIDCTAIFAADTAPNRQANRR